jgi:hypothetical protein
VDSSNSPSTTHLTDEQRIDWLRLIQVMRPALWRLRHNTGKKDRLDRRFTRNQNGKRKVVVIVRERGGNSVPTVFHSESQASAFIRARIAKGTVVHADEAGSWDNLHQRFEVKRINHQEAYSLDGACTNWAEEYFSRLRRAEVGIHHHIAGAYLLRYAQESSWREDNRRVAMAIR